MYCEKLTKQQLLDWGFTDVEYVPDAVDPKKQFIIKRFWRTAKGKAPRLKTIAITEAICRHKYSDDKTYLKITFSINNKQRTITLARIVYAWYNGDLEDGEVVDHINNNSFDNSPYNLQKLTVGENLAKRNMDNARYARNQYEAQK